MDRLRSKHPLKRATWDIDHVYHAGESMLLKKIWASSEPLMQNRSSFMILHLEMFKDYMVHAFYSWMNIIKLNLAVKKNGLQQEGTLIVSFSKKGKHLKLNRLWQPPTLASQAYVRHVTNVPFAWLISPTFSVNVQYFSLTINQPTVLSVMAYQPNEQGTEHWLAEVQRRQ